MKRIMIIVMLVLLMGCNMVPGTVPPSDAPSIGTPSFPIDTSAQDITAMEIVYGTPYVGITP